MPFLSFFKVENKNVAIILFLQFKRRAEVSENTIHTFKTPYIIYSHGYNDPQTCLCALKCRELPFIATPGTVLSTFTNLLNLLNNQKVGTFINSILQRRKLSF